MSKNFISTLALLLTVTFVAPTALLIAPQRASAAGIGCIGGLVGGLFGSAASKATSVPVSDAANTTVNSSTAGTVKASCINDLIVIPLARAAIRMVLQKMTASVVNWINGANGTHEPSYVQNLSGNTRRVGDNQMIAFIAQFSLNSNSPFSKAIASSLRANYMQNTSSNGFWVANRDTLSNSSTDVNGFLAGDWSKGGASAWFALTTQDNNNPYTLYQNAQSQLSSLVGNAIAVRTTELNWGQGFTSWCGSNATVPSSSSDLNDAQKKADALQQAFFDATDAEEANVPETMPPGGYAANTLKTKAAWKDAQAAYESSRSRSSGINPGDPCTNKDGTPSTIKTPGSVVLGYAQKALGSGVDQLVSANDLDNSFSQIVSALTNKVLGGVGGLFGASSGSSDGKFALTRQLQDYSANSASATESAASLTQSMNTQIATYQTAWGTINAAAKAASASVTALMISCPAQADVAKAVLKNDIQSVFDQFAAAQTIIASSAEVMKKVGIDSSATATNTAAYITDIQKIQGMSPTTDEVASAQANARDFKMATAIPKGSLTVLSDSLTEKMNLITENAKSPVYCITQSASGSNTEYKSDWATIGTAANEASIALIDLNKFCTDAATKAQDLARKYPDFQPSYSKFYSRALHIAENVRTVLIRDISPALSDAEKAAANTSPTTAEISEAQQNVSILAATAEPDNSVGDSILVSDGSLLSKLNLIIENVPPVRTNCRKERMRDFSGNAMPIE